MTPKIIREAKTTTRYPIVDGLEVTVYDTQKEGEPRSWSVALSDYRSAWGGAISLTRKDLDEVIKILQQVRDAS